MATHVTYEVVRKRRWYWRFSRIFRPICRWMDHVPFECEDAEWCWRCGAKLKVL